MSRTKHSHKQPGTEYWTRRPFNRHGQAPGAFAKHRTHKAERASNRQEVRTAVIAG